MPVVPNAMVIPRVRARDRSGRIVRRVVRYDDINIPVGLPEYGLDRSAQESGAVPNRDADRDQRMFHQSQNVALGTRSAGRPPQDSAFEAVGRDTSGWERITASITSSGHARLRSAERN